MGAVMRLVSRLVSRCWMTALVLSAGLAAGDAQAALQGRAVPTNGDPIAIEIGEGQLLRLDRAMASAFIANPQIADVTAKSDRLLSLFGKRLRTTTLFALDGTDNDIANASVPYDHSLPPQQGALTEL